MRVVFMGSGEFGLPTLRTLCKEHDVALVITQPDRPAGRKRKLTATPIGVWAEGEGMAVLKPDDCNAEEVILAVRDVKPDAMVIVAYGQYIRCELADIPRFGSMNLHGSLLPRYRGAAPINWAIIRGEVETGNTVIRIAKRMDAGDILGRQVTMIDPMETAGELHDRLSAIGPGLVLDVLARLASGEAEKVPQVEADATTAPKLSRADGRVDFNVSADEFRCRVHGLTPWPGVSVFLAGDGDDRKTIKLCRVESLEDYVHDAELGTLVEEDIVGVGGDKRGDIKRVSGGVRIVEVQLPGKRVMKWADFLRGHRVGVGSRFYSE